MELNEFIKNFAEQLEDVDVADIQADTVFHDLDAWDSLAGMGIMAMAKQVYGKTLTGKEIRECVTVEDLFKVIASK